jgi:O-antigen/teichoic acid export membrane protein
MRHSIRKRFAFTVGANLVRSALGFLTGILMARWLGPIPFGTMAFLLGTFLAVRQLLDMGSSSAFFTFLSQRRRSRQFILGFYAWQLAQFLMPLLVVGLIFPGRWISFIWHGEHRSLVLAAYAATFMQNGLWPVIQQAGESQRETLWVQGASVVVSGFNLLAIALLQAMGQLGLCAIFVLTALEFLLLAIIAHNRLTYATGGETQIADPIFAGYVAYCLPLVPYGWVSFAYLFADRWLLQAYGGGSQQAYYAVGAQLSSIALIATTSILSIFWKEIAESNHRRDFKRAGILYQRVSRLLFFVGAVAAGLFIPWTKELLRLLLGPAYVNGAAALGLMFLYPMHQSMGQIGSTMLLATERVKLQVVIGCVSMLASIVVTYFMLAPPTARIPGLGWAAEGLALKMVLTQIVTVNFMAYMISRIWKWPFDWLYQPISAVGCIGLGIAARYAIFGIVPGGFPLPVAMALAGILYAGLICGSVYLLPWLIGMTQLELRQDLNRVWRGFWRSGQIYAPGPGSNI